MDETEIDGATENAPGPTTSSLKCASKVKLSRTVTTFKLGFVVSGSLL